MKEVDDFDAGVLLVEFLVFGPPFPGDGVGELGELLLHGAGVIEDPLGLPGLVKAGEVDANAAV